ncbi:hypothetical protein BB561_000948 [Smittium simulii]|uniref:Uncharacterized protein n=1 Tax=Smittium simulii TaxID=133385 RepID=A0A2T9YX24_9FUNG|nr:hypothetical protein BB561_000948 [Smittium simulii]
MSGLDTQIPQNDGADDTEYLETTSAIPFNYDSEKSTKNGKEVDIDALVASMQNEPKRLCERWLDNLFMLLYEDLRVYTMWRTEMYHLKANGKNILKHHSQLEWEALGDVSYRLKHYEESQIAYTMATDYRFSFHAWVQLLKLNDKINKQKILEDEESDLDNEDDNEALAIKTQENGDSNCLNENIAQNASSSNSNSEVSSLSKNKVELKTNKISLAGLAADIKIQDENELKESLSALVWLIVYIDRWYDESVYPTFVCKHLIHLIARFGSSKVQNTIVSMNLKPDVFKLVFNYIGFTNTFQTPGHQW